MDRIEEIREAIWQKNKPEEMALIKEIEQAQRILTQLQQKYRDFETRVTKEVDTTLSLVSTEVAAPSTVDLPCIQIKVKSKCSVCKVAGHTKKTCTSPTI